MYIEMNSLLLLILALLGSVALVYIIITLKNLSKLISGINDMLNKNRDNIDELCNKLPKISDNLSEISDNVKDVTEVVTETTADVIVAKDSLINNIEVFKDILNILIGVFVKK